jgi:hypothetical protein
MIGWSRKGLRFAHYGVDVRDNKVEIVLTDVTPQFEELLQLFSNVHVSEDGSDRCVGDASTRYAGTYNAEQALEVPVRTW